MADLEFNTTPRPDCRPGNADCLSKYWRVGPPTWSPIGKRVEDSSIEFDWQTETKVDIFGDTYATGKKATKTQAFDPVSWTALTRPKKDLESCYQREQCQCLC